MSGGLSAALERLRTFLRDLGRPAAIIGGIAVIARVGTRATRDVDVVISAGSGGVDECLVAATRHGYAYDDSDRALFEEGLIRLRPAELGEGGFGVDLIVADVPYLERVIGRATPVDLAGVVLPVDLDLAYVRRQTAALGVLERLQLYFGDQDGGG